MDKLDKYKDFTFKPGISFQPFVVEEFGAVHKEAMDIFNRLCEFISIRQNKPLTQVKFKYSKLLSSAIQHHNIALFCDFKFGEKFGFSNAITIFSVLILLSQGRKQ